MISIPDVQPIELDDLAAYADDIPYLLGLEAAPQILYKNAETVQREFNQDKWGILLEKLRSVDNASIEDADQFNTGENKYQVFYSGERLYLADLELVQRIYFDFIRGKLMPLLEKTQHLVELGAGYGSIILKLAALPSLSQIRYTAGEFTETGINCIRLLAASKHLSLEADYCDLNNLNLCVFDIPENSVFLTCWAMAYLKGFPRSTLHEIIRHKPTVVVHIEPMYEHWSKNSLLHLLWKRYLLLNDYNQTILSALKSYEKEGLIKITEESKNLFGNNPLAPFSIIKWIPIESP